MSLPCFFRSGKTRVLSWWLNINLPVGPKNSSKFFPVYNLGNMIRKLGSDQFWRWSDLKHNNAATFTEKSNEPYFFLGSSSYVDGQARRMFE